jgi:precorrin-3B C17-methyltransferase
MTFKALDVLKEADVIIGYKTYMALIEDMFEGKEIINSGMTKEVDRSLLAIDQALQRKKVAVVSSGDPGVFGMAGIVLELVEKKELTNLIKVEIIPGISSANAAAASLGAPLMHDYVILSLSDLLTPWDLIMKRLDHAAQGDFVVALYNPVSKKRTEQIKVAREIMLKHKKPETPVGIVRSAKRGDETIVKTTLADMLNHSIDMFTMVIIGNSQTYTTDNFMITPRGYRV